MFINHILNYDFINNSVDLSEYIYHETHRFYNIDIGRFYNNSYQKKSVIFHHCDLIKVRDNYFNESNIYLTDIETFEAIGNVFESKNEVITYSNINKLVTENNTFDKPNEAIRDLDYVDNTFIEIGTVLVIGILVGSNIYFIFKKRRNLRN